MVVGALPCGISFLPTSSGASSCSSSVFSPLKFVHLPFLVFLSFLVSAVPEPGYGKKREGKGKGKREGNWRLWGVCSTLISAEPADVSRHDRFLYKKNK